MRVISSAGALLLAASAAAQQPAPKPVELRRGMIITKSATAVRRTYDLIGAATLDTAIIVIRGDHIVLDLNGATLRGSDPAADPDRRSGLAIRVEGGTDITIRNGTIQGYRVNILARGTTGLVVADLDAGRSWKPRLYSLKEHESLADWLSFHHNEKGEWLRFGAGIYLDSVNGGEIHDVRAEQGMNALLLVNSAHLSIHDDTFQFNSGLGIGLYRSSDNRILHNRLDYNVRGYSYGTYWRGQDSADLLFFEQSSRNVVAYNSATHGGDGFFLWAGQQTMDTGEGGANDNVLFGNDFAFAPTNAIEATFSRNVFIANRAGGSDHGLWGGYSYDSKIAGNCFAGDRIGIAIEHGQQNAIVANRFDRDATGIRLWGDKLEPSDWGYPKHRDTESHGTRIEGNAFTRLRAGLSAANTRDLTVVENDFLAVDTVFAFRDTSAIRLERNGVDVAIDTTADACAAMAPLPEEFARLAPPAAPAARAIPSSALSRRDRSAIIIDEWGPYDWQSPKLWPVDSTHATPLRLAVLGPPGTWKVVTMRGIVGISANSGAMGDTITVSPRADSLGDWAVALQYRGAGEAAVRFTYTMFEPAQDWTMRAFAWSDSTDPRAKPAAFAGLLRSTPVMTARARRLDYEWYRPKVAALPLERWALEATTHVELAPGTYTLRTISDDGVRVWVDGVLVIDDWRAHESAVDVAPLMGGSHEMRVQYYQVDGWTELRLDIVKGVQRAGGSPGPH